MVSGQRPFQGQYDQALLYEIVHEEPAALTGLRTGVPIELELLASKCLAKDREDRYQHASDTAVDLRTLGEKLKSGRSTILRTTNLAASVPATAVAGQTLNPVEALPPDAVVVGKRKLRALQALAALVTIALLGLAFVYFTQAPPPTPLRRFSFAPDTYTQNTSSISPDGESILYLVGTGGQGSLWLRSLSDESAREVAGTAGATRGAFWSPDSLSIGFRAGRELKRVSINGGDPITLCELPGQSNRLLGGTWSHDGERIVFSSGLQLYEIAARGGQPEVLFDASDSPRADSVSPHFLPTDGGSHGLAYVAAASFTDQMLAVMDLETGERRELGPGSRPVYSSDGYLIHGPTDNRADQGLRALPFSLDTLEATGQSFPIDETGSSASVSLDGTLVYSDGATGGARRIVVRDRSGEIVQTVGEPITDRRTPAVSPDGRYVAISVQGNIWVYDLDRDVRTRLTATETAESLPVWSASGREVAYVATGEVSVMARVADGSAPPRVLVETDRVPANWGVSADNRYVAYAAGAGSTEGDGGLSYHERGANGAFSERIDFLLTPDQENGPQFSRDGRYLAYNSDESGRYEVYVRPFPEGTSKWQASTNGGRQPRWSSDGSELFYVEASTNMLMAVAVSTGSTFTVGAPQTLFASQVLLDATIPWRYDVFPDGQRFVLFGPVGDDGDDDAATTTIRVVENWYEEFRDRER